MAAEERFLLAGLATVIAALIGSGLAAAKLFADKETKVSEFRLAWVATLRQALSELLGEAMLIVGRVKIAYEHAANDRAFKKRIPDLESELLEHWESFRKAYYLVLLHFNFVETSVSLRPPKDTNAKSRDAWRTLVSKATNEQFGSEVQAMTCCQTDRNASPAVIELIKRIEDIRRTMSQSYDLLPGEIENLQQMAVEATWLANMAIKAEWVRVKKGEDKFRRISWGSVILLGVCVAILIYFVVYGLPK